MILVKVIVIILHVIEGYIFLIALLMVKILSIYKYKIYNMIYKHKIYKHKIHNMNILINKNFFKKKIFIFYFFVWFLSLFMILLIINYFTLALLFSSWYIYIWAMQNYRINAPNLQSFSYKTLYPEIFYIIIFDKNIT